jgi:hypothetical protein
MVNKGLACMPALGGEAPEVWNTHVIRAAGCESLSPVFDGSVMAAIKVRRKGALCWRDEDTRSHARFV